MYNTIETETEAPKRYQCRHIFTDGHRCGSPCLRGEDLCYYHHTTRKPAPRPHTRRSRRSTFELPLPDPNDRSAIQHSIGQVLQRIAANEIDPRRAGLLLYGLQIASLNLPKPPAHRNAKPEPVELVEEITTDPELGTLAPPAEVGQSTERKSRVALLIEQILEDDKRKQQIQPQPATLPTLQAAEDNPPQPNPCNSPNPVVALSSACRAATHLRSLPSAIGAIQRPAESSHASLNPPRTFRVIDLREPQPKKVAALSFSRNTCKERP